MLTDDLLNNQGPGYGPPARREMDDAIRARIGQALKACYEPPRELPPELVALALKLDLGRS